jgi:hypothetical protein
VVPDWHRVLGDRYLPIAVALLALVVCIPSLWLGLQNDDHYLRLVLSDPPLDSTWVRSPFDAFAFVNGDEHVIQNAIADGRLPWWTHPRLRLAFLRPVTSLTHWIDFRIWPNRPWLMHLQSLLWFAGAIFAAALLYRRLLLPAWVAGLAAILFAIDDAHGMPAAWIANRNASIGVLFGLAALIAHDRWRRDGWRPGAIAAPVALALGLLAGEITLAAGGYLLAYALYLDKGAAPRRLATLIPSGLVGAGWWIAYRMLGYGAGGSGVYIDPGADPVAFLHAAAERLPLLFSGQWAFPSSLSLMFSQQSSRLVWLVAVGTMLVVVALLLPILSRDRVARFFAFGMFLSLIPACATFPDDRLLFFAGFGGMGLLAQFLAAVGQRHDWVPSTPILRFPILASFWVLVAIHMVIAPLALAATTPKLVIFRQFMERAAGSLPSDPTVADHTALVVNAPSAFITVYAPLMQALEGRATPSRTLTLGSGIYPMTISRPGAKVLTIRPAGGYLASRGSPQPSHEDSQPAFDPLYFHQMLDQLYRDSTPMHGADQITYGGCIVKINQVTEDGRPHEVSFFFATDLDDPSLRWLQWKDSAYAPFEPPEIGETVVLAAVTFP